MKKTFTLAKSIKLLLIVLFTSALMINSERSNAQYTVGDLIVTDAVSASLNNTTLNLIDIKTSGAAQSAGFTVSTPATTFRVSGSSGSNGYAALSNNGTLYNVTGANSNNTSTSMKSLTPKAVGSVNNTGTFSISTTYTNNTGNSLPIGATSLDNTNWFISDQGGIYTNNANSTTGSPAVTTLGSIRAFGGTVYTCNTASGPAVGIISAVTGGTFTGLTGVGTNSKVVDFYLISSGTNGANYDILYVLSQSSATAGIIAKYSLVAGSWVANSTYTTAFGGIGMAAQAGSGSASLYVTTGKGGTTVANNLIKLTDAAGYNANISITTANNVTLFTAPAADELKGVDFAPVTGNITLSPVTLTPFTYTEGSGPATAQSFTVSAINLTSGGGTITIAGSPDYEVSTTSATTGFAGANGSVTLTYTGTGTISPNTVWVRMIAGLTNAASPYNNETITLSGGGGVNSIAASGTVTASVPTITVTPTALTGLVSTIGSTTQYLEQTYTVSGINMGANDIYITPPAGVEIGLTSGGESSSVISLTPTSGSVSNTTIYVRIANTASAGTFAAVSIRDSAQGGTTKLVAVSGKVLAAPVAFTTGDIVVNRSGAGFTSLSSGATTEFVDEYTTGGTLVQSIMMPNVVNGLNRRLVESGSASSNGIPTLSLDGQYMLITGYDTTAGIPSVNGTSNTTNGGTVDRIVARIDYNGNVNTTSRIGDGYNANNIRSAASIDGSAFWTSGAGTVTDGGPRYITLGSHTSTQLSAAPANAIAINIFGNQLWGTSQKSPNIGINTIGSGVPTTSAQTPTLVVPVADASEYAFLILDRDATVPGVDVMYVADQTSGLLKYGLVGGTWTAEGAVPGVVSGVTGKIVGSSVVLYVTVGAPGSTGNTIYTITDNAAYNATITSNGTAITSAGTLVASAFANTTFRGVTFAPVALPATPVVAVSAPAPAAANIQQGSSNNVLYQLSLGVTGAQAIVTNVNLTTGGSYNTSDFVANSFKLWYSPNNSLNPATDVNIGVSPVVATGGSVSFNIAQPIPATTTGYLYLTADVIGSATVNDNINITATSLSNISIADAATKTGTAAAGGLQTIISSALPTVFYSNGGNLDNLANWGDNTDGSISVSGPANFTTDGYIFNVANGSTTIGANWTVSGTNAKVVVLTGQSFTVPAAFSFTGTVDANATGTLTLQNATVPTFGILDPASAVVFGSGSSVTQTVPGGTYGNLTITGAGTKVIGGVYNSAPIEVMGNLLFDNASVDRTLATLQTIGFHANLTVQNGISYTTGYNTTVNLEAKGTANQVITSNGLAVDANRFYVNLDNNSNGDANKPSGSVTLSSANGGTKLVLAGDLRLNMGNASPANTGTFVDNGQSISVAGNVEIDGSAANYTLTGTLVLNAASGTQTLEQNGVAGATSAIKANLGNLSIQTTGTGSVTLEPATGSATITINGSLNLSSTSSNKFSPNGNTINIGGNLMDTKNADEIAAGTSTFVFNGSTLQTISTSYTAGESLFNVQINNAASVQLSGTSGAIKITGTGNLNMIAGTLVTNAGKVILNNTATINESTTSYVIGTVTSTRTLSANTNETFGGMGIEVDALGSAPGSTTATRVTGVSSPIGCTSSSILRKFTLAPATNTGLNATVVFHYLASSFELNGFSGSNLSLFESTNGGSSWNSLVSTDNSGASTVTTSGMSALGLIAASTPVPVGGMVTPINSIVCPSSSATLTANGATGTLQWQSSTDNVNWSDIAGETNATYSASPSVKTYYRATATFPGCLVVSSTTGVVEVSSPTITVTSTSITGNSVTLNWSPVGTGNYSINFSGASSGTLTSVTPPKTVGGLTAGGTYDFTITQTGASLTGCPASGSLTNVTTQCAAPANVAATSPSANQLQVSWTGTPGTNYRVFYRPLFSYNTYFTKDVINNSSVVITRQGNNNIYASNTYEVYVTTLDCPTTGAVGAPSNFVYVTTLPTVACATPVIDSVRSICPVQIEVFIHPNPDITNYTVYLQRETPTVLAVNSYGIASNYFTINTPYSGDQYLIAVEAKCSSNSVSAIAIWPGNVTIKPLCDGPANLILSNPTCHGFTASWNADECVSNSASGYDLYLRVAGTINYNSYGVGLPANGLSPSDVINWLSTGRTYQVFVRSIYNCNGFVTYGPVSQTLSINTLSSGCRDEEDAPATEQAPAVQQTAPDNSEVMTLYPNPNNGQFEVALSSLNTDDREVRVEVMNMLGQTVVTHFSTIGGGQYNEQIKLPSVSAGTYIVRVTVGKNTYTSKINVSK